MADEAGVTGDTKPKLKKAVPGQGNSGCKTRQNKQGNPANPWVWVLKAGYSGQKEEGKGCVLFCRPPCRRKTLDREQWRPKEGEAGRMRAGPWRIKRWVSQSLPLVFKTKANIS